MSVPVLTFFNNKGGVGKTSLIYHLAWILSDLDKRVVIADLDPQANLTAAFLEEERVDEIWESPDENSTVYQFLDALINGVGDLRKPNLYSIDDCLYLIPGDMRLSRLEDGLSDQWPRCMDDNNLYRPMRIISSFWQILQMAAEESQAELILTDIGPNLGAINRSVLLATDYVAIPLGADLFSLQGLKNLGPSLDGWRKNWKKRLDNWNGSEDKTKYPNFYLPKGSMQPIGYLCRQHGVRLTRPVIAYDRWVQRIPRTYREMILNEEPADDKAIKQQDDPYCLATIKHYRSLVPMGQEYRKPIFKLTPADGAIGSHAGAVQDARRDFERLARRILDEMENKGMEK
ncbi:ParA family protein [Thioalkalivibrio sp. HK1]|uniref:ParA family protein n=1 Tax=Thioalkalivibrio sp. HK1 TaxID=1469245 RepID=UPI0004718B3D|nr:ParA family protein [Thioalkalivibrio sp. HK1]